MLFITFADELNWYLRKGMTLQYLDRHTSADLSKVVPEVPVYFKKTHSSRPDGLQDLWAGRLYQNALPDRSM